MEVRVKHQKASQRERKKPTVIMKDPIPRALVLAGTQRNILLMAQPQSLHSDETRAWQLISRRPCIVPARVWQHIMHTYPFLVNQKDTRPPPYSKWGKKIENRQQPRQRFMEAAVRKVLRQRTTLQELMTPKYHKGPLQKLVCHHYQELPLRHDEELSAGIPSSLQPLHLDVLTLVLASTQMWENEIC